MQKSIVYVLILLSIRAIYRAIKRRKVEKETEGMTESEKQKYLRQRREDSYIKSPVINWIVRTVVFLFFVLLVGWLVYILVWD